MSEVITLATQPSKYDRLIASAARRRAAQVAAV